MAETYSKDAGVERHTLREEGPGLATVAIAAAAVAILEPELLAGLLIGAAAMAVPKVLPAIGGALRGVARSTISTTYSAARGVRESMANMNDEFRDIVAEVQSEHATDVAAPSEPAPSAPESEPRRHRKKGHSKPRMA